MNDTLARNSPSRNGLSGNAPFKHGVLAAALALALGACATMGGEPEIPEGAVENTRTESNGDVVTEYRVGTQLRLVKVVPARGPTYYLYDRNGDGIVDDPDDRTPMTYNKLFEW